MKTLGNILLTPLKVLLLIGYLISIVGFILIIIFEQLSTYVIGTFISLCLIIVIGSVIFYGTDILENPVSMMALIAFIISVVITLLPFVFKGLLAFFKKGLVFWF